MGCSHLLLSRVWLRWTWRAALCPGSGFQCSRVRPQKRGSWAARQFPSEFSEGRLYCFPSKLQLFMSPATEHGLPVSPRAPERLLFSGFCFYFYFFYSGHPSGWEVISIAVLICMYLIISDVVNLLICLLIKRCTPSLEKWLFDSFVRVFN